MKYLIISTFLLAGCATPYQPLGARGGYEETKITDDIYIVSFHGNAYTRPQQAMTYCLYRAAELTKKNGKCCFSFSGQNEAKTSYMVNSAGAATVNGNTAYGTGMSTITAMNRPSTSATITMHDKKIDGSMVAEEVLRNMEDTIKAATESDSAAAPTSKR